MNGYDKNERAIINIGIAASLFALVLSIIQIYDTP